MNSNRRSRAVKLLVSLVITGLLGLGGSIAPAATAAVGPRVAIQAGHWRANEAPWPFRISTGGSVAGVDERTITLDVAQRVGALLRPAGIEAEVLPAWFPSDYAADAFLALHVNGSPNPAHRGFFADRSDDSRIPEVEERLTRLINSEYAKATGLPYIYRPTPNSRRYYGYYRVTGSTPAALIEMGFLTNETDRAFLTSAPQTAAQALATAIQRFLADAAPRGAAQPLETERAGTLRSEPARSAALRLRPTRQSPALGVIPDGSKVAILGTRSGEVVEGVNPVWYLVRWQGRQGYVYTGLVE